MLYKKYLSLLFALMVSVILFVGVYFTMNNELEVNASTYERIILIVEEMPELKSEIENMAKSDNKISGNEYWEIERIYKAKKRKRLLEGLKKQ